MRSQPKVLTVLRSGGDFTAAHVQALQRQIDWHAPWGTQFECLSDAAIEGVETIPLEHNWPGWWSKMEIFRPDMDGDFLFMDLDTVVVNVLDDIFRVGSHTVLRDFYRDGRRLKKGIASGLMYLTPESRKGIYEKFLKAPQQHMAQWRNGGDQKFLESVWGVDVPSWQERLPNQVVSYKAHCCRYWLGGRLEFTGVPKDAAILCFHGVPRPWETEQFKELYK